MKFAILLIVLGVVVASASPAFLHEHEYQSMFTKWMVEYNKRYDLDSIFVRYKVWKENLNYIHDSNQRNRSYTLAMNKFGDLTTEEFRSVYTMTVTEHDDRTRTLEPTRIHHDLKPVTDDGSLSWISQGFVTDIKDQQQCGSCWSFSSTGALEFLTARNGGLTPLSEQCLIDCSSANNGCTSGWPYVAYEFVKASGIASEAAYPYIAAVGTCQPYDSVLTNVGSWVQVEQNSEDAMMSAIQTQTLSILLCGEQKPFQYYAGGVLDTDDGDCGTVLDHAVLLVGYGTDPQTSKQYWTIKNSWGSGWGESGYIRIVRGKNECNLSANPTYPTF